MGQRFLERLVSPLAEIEIDREGVGFADVFEEDRIHISMADCGLRIAD